jgi:hypothetical protein
LYFRCRECLEYWLLYPVEIDEEPDDEPGWEYDAELVEDLDG